MELNVQIDKPSNITRKLTIKVPAKTVANHFQRGLAEVQKTARLKGFRPGQAPISVIKQFYGEDVRHRVYHNLIDESFQHAVREHKLKAVGAPKIESPEHKTGEGEHDHSISEDKDFTFTATVEILPEIEVKNYTGIALEREEVKITDQDVEVVVKNILDSQAQLTPVGGGLVGPDGKSTGRPVQKGDFVDMNFKGGIVSDSGTVEEKQGMSGQRTLEVGSDTLIPGFEDHLVGMRGGETKTFRVPFPADFYEKELAGKMSEFTVTIHEVKEKKLPELNDEFAKNAGYESVDDFKKKAREYLLKERTTQVESKLKGDVVKAIIEKNAFDVPSALIESQTRALAQDWAEEMKRQGVDETTIRNAIVGELDGMRKRAESQVRASLLLEAIAGKEKIEVSAEDFETELKTAAQSMNADPEQLRAFYAKNPGRKEDFEFRLRQERTLKFLLDKAKIKSKS